MPGDGFSIVLPLLGIMLAGYVFGKFNFLPNNSSLVISRFVFLAAMPAFIFISLANIQLKDFFNWSFLAVLGGGMLIIFVSSVLVAKHIFNDNLLTQSMHALTAMFSSTAYIGLPLIVIIFGDAGLVPGIVGAVITGAIFMPLAIILAEFDKGDTHRKLLTTSLIAVIQNPLLIATVAGLLTAAFNTHLPVPAVDFLELLGSAFIPCSLFAAGLFVSGYSITGEIREISWLVFVKLLLHPLVTWWLAFYVFDLDPILATIAVLQAALPSGVPVFVIAQHYNCFVSQSSGVIVVSTALSLITLPALIILLA